MKRFTLIPLMLFISICCWAQPQPQNGQPRFDPEKFKQMVEQSLTAAAEFTPEEAKAFFPLYNEMRDRQRENGRQIHELKKNCSGDSKACAATILKIKQLQVEMANMEQDYYKRMIKAVPPEKVFKVMKAEDDFHRRMVQGQRRDGNGKGMRRDGNGQRKNGRHSESAK